MKKRDFAALLAPLLALSLLEAGARASTIETLLDSLPGSGAVFDGSRARGGAVPVAVPARASRPDAAAPLGPDAAPAPVSSSASPRRAPETARGVSAGRLGLYPEDGFVLGTGRCESCRAPEEGKWYFPDELIATPKEGAPALVWLGAREMLEDAVLSDDGLSLRLRDGSSVPLELTAKIPANRSYYDASSLAYLRGKRLRVRGDFVDREGRRVFVARSLWPEGFRIEPSSLETAGARGVGDIDALVKSDRGGAKGPFKAKLLWERPGYGRRWAGLSVMGMMLNGAQGDDDEAHGGHAGFFTGVFPDGGSLADWMVNNFYSLDSVSEKGIVAALVPLDKYMADLNSGQSWYRPTDMLVAILKDPRAPLQLQEKFKERYADFYAHRVLYDHTFNPCTAQIVDPVRQSGWRIPEQGKTPDLVAHAISGMAGLALGASGKKELYDLLRQEPTHLYPRAAFDSAGADLLSLAGAEGAASPGRELSPLERALSEDLVAVLWVRVPQLPSSRRFGREAVGGLKDYFSRVPLDRSKWEIVPVPPRPFPPPR